jgi:hypothetical protein
MTESPSWWKRRTTPAKAITILASLCILEIGLCSALPWDSKLNGPLAALFFLSAVGLLLSFLMWLIDITAR